MSNIITARDPDVIAAEINTIKKAVREIAIRASIEIGGKLTEAKTMVNHGEWGKWLEENVEYSQSTANYLMQFYQQYGGNQESMFDNWTNSELFEKLSVSKHIALLSLPFADRKDFAERHDAEHLSTRQLQKAIQEQLDEERRKHQHTQGELESAQAQLRDANQSVIDMQQQLSAAQSAEGAWQKTVKKLETEKHLAVTGEKNAMQKVEVLENQLKDARAKERKIRAELKQAREHPEVPESMMEELRKEAEAAAAQQATADIQKQLDTANAALAEANAKVKAAQNSQRMSNPDVLAIQALGEQMLANANVINGHKMKAVMKDENNAQPIKNILIYILKELRVSFGIKKDELGD